MSVSGEGQAQRRRDRGLELGHGRAGRSWRLGIVRDVAGLPDEEVVASTMELSPATAQKRRMLARYQSNHRRL